MGPNICEISSGVSLDKHQVSFRDTESGILMMDKQILTPVIEDTLGLSFHFHFLDLRQDGILTSNLI